MASTSGMPSIPTPPADRFDVKVRQDFFDGMRGDPAALDRAMALCEAMLAAHPEHAEAMVWHGAGLMMRSSAAFRAGDGQRGLPLFQQGLGEMDRAVELAPTRVGVRIPRGAVLLAMAPYVPDPQRTRLLERGVSDYEATLAEQRSYFATLTLHSREQLLYGLTDGYAHLGKTAKAQAYFKQMETEAHGSELLTRAAARARGEKVVGETPCEQCHASPRYHR